MIMNKDLLKILLDLISTRQEKQKKEWGTFLHPIILENLETDYETIKRFVK